MTDLLDAAALVVAAGGVLLGLPVALVAGVRTAVAVVLDLLLAAGLLRLAADPAWDRVLTTAAIVVVRQLASAGVRLASPTAHPHKRSLAQGQLRQ